MSIGNILRTAVLLVLPVLVITCDDNDEITPRPYPRVRTSPVDEITSESATLRGELISLSEGVIDHGFTMSRNRGFTSFVTTISLGPSSQVGPFEAVLNENMEEGVVHFVRAFAKSKSHQVVGDVVEFVSLGSKAPELISITPVTGTWGSKIVLKGKRFANEQSKVVVKFGDAVAVVQKATADSIVCLVPNDLHHAPSDVSVSVFGNVSKLVAAFQLTRPVINSINPNKGYVGTLVTIKGNFFRTPTSTVLFGDVPATITKTTQTEIECIVPPNAGFGIVNVRVNSGTGNLFAETTFEIPQPIVLDFSPKTGTYRNTITITGEMLNPVSSSTVVKFGNSTAQIVSLTATEIEVLVPDHLESATNIVTVITEGGETSFDAPFTLLPMSITSIEPTSKLIAAPLEITINGQNFGYTGSQVTLGGVSLTTVSEEPARVIAQSHSTEFSTHDLDLTLSVPGQSATIEDAFYTEWIRAINSNPGELSGYHEGVKINGDLYLFVNPNGIPGIYKLDQASNTWELVSNTIPPLAQDQFKFSMNGKGYFGGGTFDAIQPSFELYEYDQSTNQWTQLNDVPFESLTSVGFTVANTSYVATSAGEVWKYNAGSDSWTQLNDVPANLIPHKGFIYNNTFYGFAESSHLVTYNPTSDTWEQGAQFPPYFYYFLFELDGRLYFQYQDFLFDGPVISFNLNALDEKEHPAPIGRIQYSYVLGDRALVFIYGMQGYPIQWWDYKPYE